MVLLQYHRKRDISYIDSRILSPTTCLEILTKQDVDLQQRRQFVRNLSRTVHSFFFFFNSILRNLDELGHCSTGVITISLTLPKI